MVSGIFITVDCSATELQYLEISNFTESAVKDFKKSIEICRKIVQIELVKVAERDLDEIRSKSEQEQKKARFERISLDRTNEAICLNRVAQYLAKYNLKIADLSQRAVSEVNEALGFSSEKFYSRFGFPALSDGGLVSLAGEKFERFYLEIIYNPVGPCDPLDFGIRGISAYLLIKSGGVCPKERVPVAATGNGVVAGQSGAASIKEAMPGLAERPNAPGTDLAVSLKKQPVLISAGLRRGSPQPDSNQFITSRVRKLKLAGAVIVKSCVDKDGSISSATIQESGGDIDLDTSAIEYAKKLIYAPATADGVPIAGCFSFRIKTSFK